MRVLVTGATGFTGGHLARGLAARGDTVRALVRDPLRARDLAEAGMTLVTGDLARRESLAPAVENVEVVYNIAALYRQAGLPAQTYRTVNAEAVGWLVEAAADAGVRRIVHCSTVGVHGDIEHPPADEDAPLRPGDVYQITKVEGEALAREAARRRGIELVIVRPSGIYGPGDRRLLKLFRGVARRRFVVLGDGKIFYHLTHIDDLVEGFRLAGTVPGAAGRTYILAGGEGRTVNEVGPTVAVEAAPFGLEPPLYRRRVDFFTKSRAFDISRARADLGFAPSVDLRIGVRRTLAWYREAGWI